MAINILKPSRLKATQRFAFLMSHFENKKKYLKNNSDECTWKEFTGQKKLMPVNLFSSDIMFATFFSGTVVFLQKRCDLQKLRFLALALSQRVSEC